MAADCVADGDYLGEYSRFFAEFVARVNPNDQLPVKVSVYDVNESELVGEIINVTLQYLNRIYCPPSLQSYIAHLVIQAIKSTCKKQPEVCGLRQQEKTYAPLKLMQAITNEVNEICRRYLDNSRLALLPPPSSTPQVTVGAMKNLRRKMEDRHMILHDLNTIFNIQDDTIVDYYAVFDGHGGQDAAAYCATHLHQYLVESVHYPTDPECALRDAFLTADAQFIAKSSTQKLNGGTTAVCALLINKKLYIAWVGDSMASLATCDNVKQLVNPHRPTREDESKRIHNMGGVIVYCMGVLRVNGFLSISRAIGDVPYKPYISGEPEVRCVTLDGTEDFLIIACDGLWDYVDQRTAAICVYRQVLKNPYNLKHVHQALLESATGAGSSDNITVIVVFLRSPIEIASRLNPHLTYQAPNGLLVNGLLLNNMDPNNPIPSNHDEFDVKPTYIKQLIDDDVVDRADFDMDFLKNSVCGMTRNGKHRNDDDEYDYTDIGPETDVDAGEDVHDNNYPLAASSSLDPSPESEKSPVETEKHNDDDRNDNNYSNRDNANVCPMDSVVDDGDVDNRVRPSERDVRGADDETLRDNGDDARTETTGTVVDDDESPPSPRAAKPLQHALIVDNVADSEDSEDEWDYYRVGPNKQESAAATIEADESRKNIEEQSAQENPESVVKDSSEVEFPETENAINCKELVKDISSPELINIDISDEKKSSEPKDQILLDLQEEQTEQDNMDFQLNPEAAEFVPLSPPLLGQRDFLQDFAISGSPLKQTQVMDDIPVPSQSEFDKEVCYRPKEIGEEFSNDEHTDLQNNSSQSMDVSEISSTKAEMGDDESMIHAMSTSQWQTNISSQWNEKTGDDAESDEESDIVTRNNPMAMSLTPGNFKEAFKKTVDLNAVHMLDDSSDGAEQISTPPRSPEPFANEDRSHTPLSEDKNSSEVLRASTPQPSEEMLTTNSDTSSETKNSSSSITHEEKKKLVLDGIYEFEKKIMSFVEDMRHKTPEVYIGHYPCLPDSQVKDVSSTQFENFEKICEENVKLTEENKEEEKEKLCKIEDDEDTSLILKPNTSLTMRSTAQLLQMIEKESTESEISKNLPDSTNHSNFNDAIHDSKQHSLQQSLLEKMHPEMASDMEQTHYHADFDSKIIPEKDFKFNEPLKIASSQLSESSSWANSYKTENFENREQKEVEDLSNKIINDDVKPDSTTELNPSDSMEQFKFMENELQHKDQMVEQMPIETITLIDKPTEQEQIEEKTAEFALINVDEVYKEKVASEEAIPSKEEESIPEKEDSLIELKIEDSKLSQSSNWTNSYKTENFENREQKEVEESLKTNKIDETESLEKKTTKASLEDTATINKSKEVTGITEASAAVSSPTKAKTATTSAKRPTKTMTTKATTASTKTVTKSMPSSGKASTTMRTTTTSLAQSMAKKPATSTATRPKQLDGSTKAAISSTSSKVTVTKTTATTKAATTITATRTSSLSPRVTSNTMRPKTTTTTSLKANSGTSIEKKSMVSGDAKSISKPATTTTTRPTSSSTLKTTASTTKTTLVKTSPTAAKTLTSSVTLKPRPTSATSTAKTTSTLKQSATGVNGASRTRPSSGTTKRESIGRTVAATTAKSPLIDKQSKETVNKQISRSGASAPKLSGRVSTPTSAATAGSTKTRTSSGKSTGNVSATSPTKKTPTSKTRISSATTKRLPLNETKVLQNGIPKEDVTKAAVITATSKLEDNVPRKDTSPVNVPTDNQLIAD